MDETLLRAIRDAFPDGAPPARPVTGHRCPECDRVDGLLGGRRWSEVAEGFPAYCHDTYPLLTPAAKAYYLPAYLAEGLRRPGTMPEESVRYALERGDLDRAAFTPAQRAVILRWAEASYGCQAGGSVPDAVRAYWGDSGP